MTTTESDSNTSNSDCSINKCSFELTDNDIIDIEETVHSLLYEYINENPLLYSKNNFRKIVEVDTVDFIISEFTDNGGVIQNLNDYYKMTRIITAAVEMFFVDNIYNIVH